MDTKEAAAVLGIILSVSGVIYMVLKMRLQSDFDNRYMSIHGCNDKHKITDVMFNGMREDMADIKETLKEIKTTIQTIFDRFHK